ncbi:hypothetical protein Tco_0987782 [Tanacetum coccineum]
MATQFSSTSVGVGSSNASTIVAVLETTRNPKIWCNYELVKLSDESLKAHCKHCGGSVSKTICKLCDSRRFTVQPLRQSEINHGGSKYSSTAIYSNAQERVHHIPSLKGDCLEVEEQLHDVEVEAGYTISLSNEEIQRDEDASSEARSSEVEDE